MVCILLNLIVKNFFKYFVIKILMEEVGLFFKNVLMDLRILIEIGLIIKMDLEILYKNFGWEMIEFIE